MRVRPLALRWHSILLPSRSFLLVPGKRSPDSSANRDWGSRAVPILQENFRLAWGIGASSSLAQTNGREGSMKPAILLVDVASTSREEWQSLRRISGFVERTSIIRDSYEQHSERRRAGSCCAPVC